MGSTSSGRGFRAAPQRPLRAGLDTKAVLLGLILASPNLCRAQGSTTTNPPVELELGDTPEETYELNALNFIEARRSRASIAGIPLARHTVWVPVLGKYRYDLDYDDFFERVGEPALAQKQRSIDTWSTILTLGGFAVVLVGIFTPLALKSNNEVTPTGLVVGGSVVLGGLAISSAGTLMWRPAVPAQEAMELAQLYNTSLAERIRRGEAADATQRSFALQSRGEWIGYQLRF